MKILYLSPVHPLLTEGDPLPRWQTQASHVRALQKLGHDVTVVRYSPRKFGPPSFKDRVLGNFRVLGVLGKFDVIMLSLGADVLLPMTIRFLLARFRVPLIILSGISPMRLGNPRERVLAPLATLIATNDPTHAAEWRKLGTGRAVVLPLSAIDPTIHYPRLAAGLARSSVDRDLDVVFAGTVSDDRMRFFQALRRHLLKSTLFVVKQFIWEEAYASLLSRAKIALNPIRPSMTHGANLRLFEIPAFGALELASFSHSNWLSPGKELVTYDDPRDAAKKIMYYLKHQNERERIARAGQQRVLREHTFVHRFRKLIRMLSSMVEHSPMRWR